jgi:hypothetical protein
VTEYATTTGREMLKLRDVPEFENDTPLVRMEHRVYAPWQAAVDGGRVTVLVEGVAGKIVFIDQVKASLIRHRQLIEQLANAVFRPGDERVFIEAEQLTWQVENAVRVAP